MVRLREGEGGSRYFSLLFLLDTPAKGEWEAADAHFSPIDWDSLREQLDGVTRVVAIPYTSFRRQYYLREIYIYISPHADFKRPYVTKVVYPALKRLTGFELAPPVFMEDQPPRPAAPPAVPKAALPMSILERIKGFLTNKS